MAITALPAQGSTSWYTWAQSIHTIASAVDAGTYAAVAALDNVAFSGNYADLAGTVSVASLPSGSVLYANVTTANYNTLARPTSRLDIKVMWTAPDSLHFPTNALAGDEVDVPAGT